LHVCVYIKILCVLDSGGYGEWRRRCQEKGQGDDAHPQGMDFLML